MLSFIKQFLKNIVIISRRILIWTKISVLPFSKDISLFEFGKYLYLGIVDGNVAMKASAVAFNLFMALFPTILFFFTLIPYVPFPGFQTTLLDILSEVIPDSIWITVETTIKDILLIKHSGLLSIGFITAFYFATNGVSSLIDSLNTSHYAEESRSWIKQRLIAILLLAIESVLIIIAILLISFGEYFITLISQYNIITSDFGILVVQLFRWFIIVALLLFSISFTYYWSPFERKQYTLITVGSVVATLLTIATTVGFGYYAANLARYNALYGSIGTLLLFLFWIYLNAFVVIFGFEINSAIRAIKKRIANNL